MEAKKVMRQAGSVGVFDRLCHWSYGSHVCFHLALFELASIPSIAHTPFSVWMSFIAVLIHRLSPQITSNGLHEIVNHWRAENPTCEIPSSRYEDFSRDIQPVPCHSHNDYLRRVPLYQALEAGCISVEADVWLHDDEKFVQDLYVGHSLKALEPLATLKKLYIDPLVGILEHQNANPGTHVPEKLGRPYGVFDSSPDTSLVLLLDFKTAAKETWVAVQEQLESLRKRGMLTSWDGKMKTITQRPITVVGTGKAPFDLIIANSTYRDVFFDAPLDQLNDTYTRENSYFASASFPKAVGKFLFRPNSSQTRRVKSQIEAASRNGLKARYWDTPSWPIARRNRIWTFLVENRIGVLNVDDIMSAGRWNWNWCIVAGLVLCG